jgi:uncharacterized membrane protein
VGALIPDLPAAVHLHPMVVYFPIAFWIGTWNRGLFVGSLVVTAVMTTGAARGAQLVYQHGVSVCVAGAKTGDGEVPSGAHSGSWQPTGARSCHRPRQ